MKFYHRIGLVFLCIMLMLIVSVGSYEVYMVTTGNKDKEKYETKEKSVVSVDKKDDTAITQRTKLKIENYNRKEGSIVEVDENMPVEYIGMDRQELEDYLESYEQSPSISDLEIGFESYQVMSFSNKQVVLRKTFLPPNVMYKYYLTSQDGCVIV